MVVVVVPLHAEDQILAHVQNKCPSTENCARPLVFFHGRDWVALSGGTQRTQRLTVVFFSWGRHFVGELSSRECFFGGRILGYFCKDVWRCLWQVV